ncbi:MAG: hypothetical protein ACI97A_003698 [Planctomycetota bacterium]|jgi:hypothetical protein
MNDGRRQINGGRPQARAKTRKPRSRASTTNLTPYDRANLIPVLQRCLIVQADRL